MGSGEDIANDKSIEVKASLCAMIKVHLKSIDDKVQKLARTSQDSKIKNEFSALSKLLEVLNAGQPARVAELTDEERPFTRDLQLITMKPNLYVANVDEAGLKQGNAHTAAVELRAEQEGSQVVRICGAFWPIQERREN